MNPKAKAYHILGRGFMALGHMQGKFFALPVRFYRKAHNTPFAGPVQKVAETSLELGYSIGHWFWWNGREMFDRRDKHL